MTIECSFSPSTPTKNDTKVNSRALISFVHSIEPKLRQIEFESESEPKKKKIEIHNEISVSLRCISALSSRSQGPDGKTTVP